MKRTVAIQVGAISFIDEGVEQVLDLFQEKAGVNNLFLASHTFDRGTGGRQIPDYPLPDHGKQEYDLGFRGGNFAKTHPQYYNNTFIREFAAPAADSGGWDILEKVIPPAAKRGIDVFCWINENPYGPQPQILANYMQVSEIDPWGRRTGTPCFRNPAYRNWHLSLVEDYVKSYRIQGIAWASERQGPLGNLLGGGGGSRYQRFVESLHQTIFRDAEPEESYAFLYRILKRALAGVAGKCEVWPGIDIDIPVEKELGKARDESPADVKAAVIAAFEAGAQGVVLSRKYSEMRLANLAAVGDALKTLGG